MTGRPAGLLLVDKPEGPTSHDVVDRIRRVTGERRIGHAGTLDPMATGLLILVIGRATKIQDLLMSEEKEYVGTLALMNYFRSKRQSGERHG